MNYFSDLEQLWYQRFEVPPTDFKPSKYFSDLYDFLSTIYSPNLEKIIMRSNLNIYKKIGSLNVHLRLILIVIIPIYWIR